RLDGSAGETVGSRGPDQPVGLRRVDDRAVRHRRRRQGVPRGRVFAARRHCAQPRPAGAGAGGRGGGGGGSGPRLGRRPGRTGAGRRGPGAGRVRYGRRVGRGHLVGVALRVGAGGRCRRPGLGGEVAGRQLRGAARRGLFAPAGP
ncbi:hypothetical protein FK511_28195, partial [Klebsiella pneumoniae]|nr:hypothetical protein [Klebsiella pneumoniae]